MIRVIYRWRVEEKDFEEFRNIWDKTTNKIHKNNY